MEKMKENNAIKRCPEYIGVSCIDGSCPKANQEEKEIKQTKNKEGTK